MFSVFKNRNDALPRQTHWDAPAHFIVRRGPRTNIELEREAAERRHRALRYIGMW